MPCNVSFYGKNKPGPGVSPVQANVAFKTPFGTKKYPVNSWNGKHPPLHKERPSFSEAASAYSTVRMYWKMAAGGDWIEQSTSPTNISGYFWVISEERDEAGVHLFYMIEKAFPSIPSVPDLELYWNGVLATCRPATPAGTVWQVIGVAGTNKIYMESVCVPMSDQPGYCPATSDLPMMDPLTGDPIETDFVDGLWPAGAGTVLSLMNSDTGVTYDYTVRIDGSLDGPAGVVGVLDLDTGATRYFRVSSTGRLEE